MKLNIKITFPFVINSMEFPMMANVDFFNQVNQQTSTPNKITSNRLQNHPCPLKHYNAFDIISIRQKFTSYALLVQLNEKCIFLYLYKFNHFFSIKLNSHFLEFGLA